MCQLQTKTVRWVPLEERYKGCQHELTKWVQETQGEIDCFV